MKNILRKFGILILIVALLISYIPVYAMVGEKDEEVDGISANSTEEKEETKEKIKLNELEPGELQTEGFVNLPNDDEIKSILEAVEENENTEPEEKKDEKPEDVPTEEQVEVKEETVDDNKVTEPKPVQNKKLTTYASNAPKIVKERSNDLVKFINRATIYDNSGNEITTQRLEFDQSYTLEMMFKEKVDLGFGIGATYEMLYELPGELEVASPINNQPIYVTNPENPVQMVKVGSYSVDSNNILRVKWLKVDNKGNISTNYYFENYGNIELKTRFKVNFNLQDAISHKTISFGNEININLNFDPNSALTVASSVTSEYNANTHSIAYEATVNTRAEIDDFKFINVMDEKFELDKSVPIEITSSLFGDFSMMKIDLSNYPSSITVDDYPAQKVITVPSEIAKYIEFGENSFTLKSGSDNNTAMADRFIKVNYSTKIKDSVINNATEAVVSGSVTNTVSASGKIDGNVITKNSVTETNFKNVKLSCSNVDLEDFIKWTIDVGDGYNELRNATIKVDFKDQTISQFPTAPVIRVIDNDGNFIKKLGNGAVSYNGSVLQCTIDTKCTKVRIVADTMYNPEELTTPYLESVVDFTNNGTTTTLSTKRFIDTNLPKIEETKSEYNIQGYLNNEAKITVPNRFNNAKIYLDVRTFVKVGLPQNDGTLKATECFVNFDENEMRAFAEDFDIASLHAEAYDYSLISHDKGFYIVFNSLSVDGSKWNLNTEEILTMKYKMPMNAKLVDANGNEIGTLEDYPNRTNNSIATTIKMLGEDQIELSTNSVAEQIQSVVETNYTMIPNSNNAVNFEIKVNPNKVDLTPEDTITVVNTMSDKIDVIENTIKVYKVNDDGSETEIECTKSLNGRRAVDNNLVISGLPDSTSLVIRYAATTRGNGNVDLFNTASVENAPMSTSRVVFRAGQGGNSGISGGTDKISFEGSVAWKDVDNISNRPSKLTVQISADKNVSIETDTITVDATSNWSWSFANLDKYDINGDEVTYTLEIVDDPATTDDDTDDYDMTIDGSNIIARLNELIDFGGAKLWVDEDNANDTRPDSITVEIYKKLPSGVEQFVDSQDVVAAYIDITSFATRSRYEEIWAYYFMDLPKYDEEGREIQYIIKEVPVENYTTTIADDGTITNTLKEPTIPSDPTDPTRPTNPPSDPTNPTNPGNPGNPTRPGQLNTPDGSKPNNKRPGGNGHGTGGLTNPDTGEKYTVQLFMASALLSMIALIIIKCNEE